jgi:hypothetical protein
LGIGDWAQSPIPNPQSPIPNPHYFWVNYIFLFLKFLIISIKIFFFHIFNNGITNFKEIMAPTEGDNVDDRLENSAE